MALNRYRWTSFVREVVFVAIGVLFLIPVGYIVMVSLKSPAEAAIDAVSPPQRITLDSFAEAWAGAGNGGLGGALVTSAVITVPSLLLVLLVSVPCAYVLVRRPGVLSTLLAGMFLLGIVIPYQLGILPLFSLMDRFGLIGSPVGVILVYLGQMTPFTVFLLMGFVRKLPVDYEEAARIDGAGPLRVLMGTVVPLLRPGIVTVMILDGLLLWNDFFVPLIWLNGADQVPVPVAIFTFVGQYTSQWSLVFAGIIIAVLPVLVIYVVAQRYLIRGFASGVRG